MNLNYFVWCLRLDSKRLESEDRIDYRLMIIIFHLQLRNAFLGRKSGTVLHIPWGTFSGPV